LSEWKRNLLAAAPFIAPDRARLQIKTVFPETFIKFNFLPEFDFPKPGSEIFSKPGFF